VGLETVGSVPYSGIGSILDSEELEAIKGAIASGDLCSGKILAQFEKAFAEFVLEDARFANRGHNWSDFRIVSGKGLEESIPVQISKVIVRKRNS
jgi:hypothetical protein